MVNLTGGRGNPLLEVCELLDIDIVGADPENAVVLLVLGELGGVAGALDLWHQGGAHLEYAFQLQEKLNKKPTKKNKLKNMQSAASQRKEKKRETRKKRIACVAACNATFFW